jgi:hypothetical protein
MARVRDYRKEYDNYHGKPEQIAKRSKRVLARREMEKEVGASALAGKDVHHKKPLRSGGGNGKSNLAITSKSHRGWNRGR